MGRTIVAGLDEFFNWLINWQMYLHALALKLLHIQARTFMHIVGVVEIVLGIVVLTRYTRYAAYVVMVWLWCIALDRVSRAGHRNLIGSVRLGGVIGG